MTTFALTGQTALVTGAGRGLGRAIAGAPAAAGGVLALAVELAPSGVRVNAVAPTSIRTPMTAPFFADAAFESATEAAIPLGRIGEPADVTGAVVFLCSPAAQLVTGTSLVVDGGYTAQ